MGFGFWIVVASLVATIAIVVTAFRFDPHNKYDSKAQSGESFLGRVISRLNSQPPYEPRVGDVVEFRDNATRKRMLEGVVEGFSHGGVRTRVCVTYPRTKTGQTRTETVLTQFLSLKKRP